MTSHPEPRSPDEPLAAAAELTIAERLDQAHAIGYREGYRAALAARPEPELDDADYTEPTWIALRAAGQPGLDLSVAWREAAEARPTGFLSVCRWEDGVYRAVWAAVGSSPRHSADGPTPAAALTALTARLRSTKPG